MEHNPHAILYTGPTSDRWHTCTGLKLKHKTWTRARYFLKNNRQMTKFTVAILSCLLYQGTEESATVIHFVWCNVEWNRTWSCYLPRSAISLSCSMGPLTYSSMDTSTAHISREFRWTMDRCAEPTHYNALHHNHMSSDAKKGCRSGFWCHHAYITSATHKMYHTLSHRWNLHESLGATVV